MLKIGEHNEDFEKLSTHFKRDIDLKGEHVPVDDIDLLNLMPSKYKSNKYFNLIAQLECMLE
jgi:hypothetical protein